MKLTGKLPPVLVIAALVFVPVLLGGCSGSGSPPENAVPSFCPSDFASNLDIAPGGSTQPRAYYQDLVTTEGVDLDITLLACDPDSPETAAGMTWSVLTGPFDGTLSAYSGTYSAQPYQVTYIPSAAGTDEFYFVCFDSDGVISNVAEILITVSPPPLTGQNLFFGGKDDSYQTHLWYYDGVSPAGTVPGSAQALASNDLDWFQAGHPFQSDIHFIVADSSGENNHLVRFDPGAQSFQYYPELDNVGEVVEYGPLLYATGQDAGANTHYLWYFGSGGWTPIPVTGGINAYSLEVFNGKLYFGGDAGGGNVQLMSYNSSGGALTNESTAVTSIWPRSLTVCNGNLYFNGYVAGDEYLWATDGVAPPATATFSVTAPGNMVCFNNTLYFTALGAPASTMPTQLWSINSSNVLTQWTSNATADFMNVFSETYPVVEGSMLYMRGTDDTYNNWIWAHDGSSQMTTVPGSNGLYPFYTKVFDGRLYFSSSATAYDQLWSYDPGTGNLSAISSITMGLYPRGFAVYPP